MPKQRGKAAKIVLVDGTVLEGSLAGAVGESVVIDTDKGRVRITHAQIRTVTIESGARGALDGFGIGVVSGVVVGLVVGLAFGSDEDECSENGVCITRGDIALGLGIPLGLGGGAAGAIIGGVSGSTLTFEF